MTEIGIQSIIEMLSQSIGIEGAEKIIAEVINESGLHRKRFYSEEEFYRICEDLKKRGGFIKIFATLVATPAFREMQYQKIIEKEKREKEEIETLYTQLQKSNKELKRMHEEIIRKEKLATIGTLASGVGHELRNPLTSIKMVAFFLLRNLKTDDPKVKNFLEILNNEVNVVNKIITDLLDFSRIRKLNKVKVAIDNIIEESIKSSHLNKKIKIIKEISSELKEIYVDPDSMKQVFVNLITNASDAVENGGEIKIKTTIQEKEMEIGFSDTGCGISKEIVDSIFEPLVTTKAKGIGLGLAIVRNIIEQHNGKITVETDEGKGTTFSIILPIEE